MITKEAIDNAIRAHGKWKMRLNELIGGKSLDFDIAKAGTDNNCDFGKWLYGDTIDENDKKSDYYIRAKTLHTDFHKVVKTVAELVMAGKKEEARKMVSDFNGEYCKLSTKLILLLAEWDKTI